VTVIEAPTGAAAVLAQFAALVDAVRSLDFARLSDDELLDFVHEVEVQRRRLATVDHALLAELDGRHLAFERGFKHTASLVSALLRVDPGEAAARVRAAAALGPRRALTGEVLEPVFPATAAACAEGVISPAHAAIIVGAVDELPADVAVSQDREVEATLLEHAQQFCPADLRKITRRLRDTYDQDGVLASEQDRARRRRLDVHQHADGSVSGSFVLDPVAGEALLSVLDPLAKPAPAADGLADPRTPTQRRHDALRDALLLVLRSGKLPDAGGVATTIVLTMTTEQYTAMTTPTVAADQDAAGARGHPPRAPGDHLVRTGHGALLHTDTARLLLGDAQIQPVVLDSVKRIHAYGSTHRLFTAAQRLAMAARDGGCSLPGCTVTPAWCQAHHIREYTRQHGPTNTDNGTLLCGYHHRHFERLGYTCTVIDGVPHWTLPTWLDRTQTPTRNSAHTVGD